MSYEKLITTRKLKGYTQEKLAQQIAMEQTTLSRKERGLSRTSKSQRWTNSFAKRNARQKIKDVLILDNYPKFTFFQIYNIHKITFPLAEAIRPSVSLDEAQF